MSDLNSMIQQVKGSGLSQAQKDELIKRIVRGGPDFDLLAAIANIKDASPKEKPMSTSEKTIITTLASILMIIVASLSAPLLFKISDYFFEPKPAVSVPIQAAPKPQPTPKPSKPYTPPREDDRGGAWVWTMGFVKERLKSPSTADFPHVWNVYFADMGNRTWKVASYVDAQNSFGATIRTRFISVVKYVGNDRWVLVSLDME
jgi:hypothetical protein